MQTSQVMPPRVRQRWDKWQSDSHRMIVHEFDHATGLAQVGRPREWNRPRPVQTVRLYDRTCTCGKWTSYHLPCSHAQALARTKQIQISKLIPKELTLDAYMATYSQPFEPIPHEDYWRKVPDWVLIPNSSRLKGRRSNAIGSRRIPNEMDVSSQSQRNWCRICQEQGHSRLTCPRHDSNI